MTEVTLYHNPRCSKSREALRLLEEHGIKTRIVRYLETPPTQEDLQRLGNALKTRAQEMIRPNETEFADAGLSSESGDDEIFAAIARYPKLLQRPIAVQGDRAVIGRPPERVLEILP
jgi:arsenate reductase